MIYFLHIGYDGSNYHGWQWQQDMTTVQGTIENALERVFKTKITVYGCGRTDAGVHASQYFLHIVLENAIDFDLKFRLNKNLPDDIAVFDVLKMEDEQHARYDATLRTYDYFIHLYKDPILNKYSSYYEITDLNFDAMQKAAAMLTQFDDFKALCKKPHLYKHTLCNITESKLFVDSDRQRLRFTITGNRFLRGMVRLSVTFLLRIGRGELTLEEFEHIMINKIDVPEKAPALPNGLFLSRIEYPYLKMDSKPNFCAMLMDGLH